MLHGAVWEFFRNAKLDAADFFENAGGIKKGELRQNQFGVSAGGPVVIPDLVDGRNKVFFFGDYEGFRRIQGTVLTSSVPTVAERNSDFTDLSDRLQTKTEKDPLGRTVFIGTVFDPTTTRQVTANAVDSVSGLTAVSSGFVRDPFSSCRSEEHTSELQSRLHLVCRLLLEKKNT